MSYNFLRIFVFLTLVFEIALSQTGGEIIERLKKKYASVDDAVVKFEQKVKYGVSKFEQSFSGTLYFKKKNKYRIETEEQVVVTDGNTSWLYSKVNKQVIIDRYKEDQNAVSPDKFLFSISDEYIPVVLKVEKVDNKKVYIVKLTPRNENSAIESAKIWVVDGDWDVTKVEITDINGTVTTYNVKSVKLNSGVKDDVFKFVVPPSVKVVDLR